MKRKYFSSAAAMLTALTLAAGTCSLPASAEDGMKIVALGDSITRGYSPDGTLIASYADIVSGYYGAELTNLAEDGLTSAGLLEQLSDASVQSAVADADVVLVTVGGNDVLQLVLNNDYIDASQYDNMDQLIAAMKTESGAPNWNGILLPLQSYLNSVMPEAIAQYRSNIAAIAEQLKSITDAELVFQTVYNPMDCDLDDSALAVSGSMNILTANVTSYLEGKENNTLFPVGQCINGAVRDLEGVTVVDTYQDFYDHGVYYTCIEAVDVHPNNKGHLVIAESVIQALGIAETGSENGTVMRSVYAGSGAENTLAAVNSAYNDSIMVRSLKNSYGDVDADGRVDLADVTDALAIYSANGASIEAPVTGVNALAADGNRDGAVDLNDASLMIGYYAEVGAESFSGTFMEYAELKK